MDTTTLYPVEIDVVEILKVYDAQKEGFAVELLYDIFRTFGECVDEWFFHIHASRCFFCIDKLREMRYNTCGDLQFVDRRMIILLGNLAQIFEQAHDIDEARDRDVSAILFVHDCIDHFFAFQTQRFCLRGITLT